MFNTKGREIDRYIDKLMAEIAGVLAHQAVEKIEADKEKVTQARFGAYYFREWHDFYIKN